MLVLSRRKHEDIVIRGPGGVEIIVGVTDIRCDKVRIGVDAPEEWTIHRREVQNRIERESNNNG